MSRDVAHKIDRFLQGLEKLNPHEALRRDVNELQKVCARLEGRRASDIVDELTKQPFRADDKAAHDKDC